MISLSYQINHRSLNILFLGWGLFIVMLIGGCDQSGDSTHLKGTEHLSVLERLPQTVTGHLNGELNSERFLSEIDRSLVQWEGEPTDFYVEERIQKIKQFPCQECHTQPVELLKSEEALKQSHWEVKLQHAPQPVMDCMTCHISNDMNLLHTLNDEKVTFNHSYQLCAQCHSKQIKEWVGGAHGKRLGGWAPPRVIKNCVGCHNPHNPKLEKRWPSWSSRLIHASVKE